MTAIHALPDFLHQSANFCAGNKWSTKVKHRHGDQIGRIFAQWVIAYSGQIFENYSLSGTLFHFIILSISTQIGWPIFWRYFYKRIWSP
jgi:hypothetical protein